MSITEQGIEGERRAHEFLLSCSIEHFQLDFLVPLFGTYIGVNVKMKKKWYNWCGVGQSTGLDTSEIAPRLELYTKTGIRSLLMILKEDEPNRVYVQWLDVLEAGQKKENIAGSNNEKVTVYPVKNFTVVPFMAKRDFTKMLQEVR